MHAVHEKRVLVVDDQRTMTTLLSAMMEKLGYAEVVVATDGAGALTALKASPFDLVISDIMMEPMTGLILTRTIRETPALTSLPVILTTAACSTAHLVAAKRVGANECLIKPFSLSALKERIARLPVSA